MRIIRARPPIFEEIIRVIGKPPPTAIFTWGELLYAPSLPADATLDPELLEHEATHVWQQSAVGGPEAWWRRYLDSPAFRVREELVAYQAQYRFACRRGLARPARREFARALAGALSGPMYGRVISKRAALEAIAHG